jgi:lysophospholipase L1-like esterase
MEDPPDHRVLFFGDSFVLGYGDPEGLGWVGRVVAASWAAGEPTTAYNLGVAAQTAVQVAARWQAEAQTRLAADPGAPHRLVLSAGSNDASSEDDLRRVPAEESVRAIGSILDGARDLDLPALVVGPPPVGDPEDDEAIADLASEFAAACRDRSVPFLGVTEALMGATTWPDEASAGDGTHPGVGGYRALARLVLEAGWIDWLRSS